ncbi:hypothetical protein KAS08_04570 [Candidatus Pacearchaeota archaeon]|nr:hypothetical protein [Candidatus Pacearchaeota archaeon]
MEIYIAHTRKFDFQKELYDPIRKSPLNDNHTFTLPHEKTDEPFNSKEYLKDRSNLLIAEISHPSISLGIELGWANIYKVPIICIYKKGSKISNSLKAVSNNFIEYSNDKELISGIEKMINKP